MNEISFYGGRYVEAHMSYVVPHRLIANYDFDYLKLTAPEGGTDTLVVQHTKRCR